MGGRPDRALLFNDGDRAEVFAGARPTHRGRPRCREPWHGPDSRGPALRLVAAELYGVVRAEYGTFRCLHRHLGLYARAGILARLRGHRDRRGPRCAARRSCDVGAQDRHGAVAARPPPVRQECRSSRGRAMVERSGLGRPGRTLRCPRSPALVPRALRRGGAGSPPSKG